jgi:GxxExxY protein
VPLVYKGLKLDCGYRLDLLVNNQIILELKAIEQFEPIHTAIMLTYLKLTGLPLGYLINFNEVPLVNGIRRIIRS